MGMAPQTVERFSELMRSKHFTNGTDCDVVIELYKNTIKDVLGKGTIMKYKEQEHWGDDEMRSFIEILPLCKELDYVDFYGSFKELTDAGMSELAAAIDAGKMPKKLTKM